MSPELETVVARLEAVAGKLEKYQTRQASSASAPTAELQPPLALPEPKPCAAAPAARPGPPTSIADVDITGTDIVAACEGLKKGPLTALDTVTSDLAPNFQASTRSFLRGVDQALGIVLLAQTRATPSGTEMKDIAAPLAAALEDVQRKAQGPRCESANHDKALYECLQGVTWVTYDPAALGMPPPSSAVAEALASAEVFLNRVLRDYRQAAPEHKVWVDAVKAVMLAVQTFARCHCSAQLIWRGPSALEAPVGSSSSKQPTPVEPASEARQPSPCGIQGPPLPPPPPAPGAFFDKIAPSNAPRAPSRSELLTALARGSDVTAGLRKVTAAMKAKNMTDWSGVVPEQPAKAARATARGGAVEGARKAPVLEYQPQPRKRWVIENHVACDPVQLSSDSVQRDHTIYIAGCRDCVVQIKGKANSILIDNCHKLGCVFESVIATVEAVNSSDLQLQACAECPSLSIDKTDEVKVFLPKATAEKIEITTSKVSSVSVTVLADNPEEDSVDHPVPEQFVTTFTDGKAVTRPAAHG